jgi:hypothetical protein
MGDPISLGLGALGATKTAFELAKSILDVRDATKLQSVRFELMNLLLEAQQAETALVADKRQLEERVRELEAWDGEKERYELKDIGNGCMAYVLKPSAAGSEPPHSLCANCYQQGRKSILTPFHIQIGRAEAMQCHACGSEMIVQGHDGREAASISARRPAAKPGQFRY